MGINAQALILSSNVNQFCWNPHCHFPEALTPSVCREESGSKAELAKTSIVSQRDPGSNLGIDKIFLNSVYIGFEFKFKKY